MQGPPRCGLWALEHAGSVAGAHGVSRLVTCGNLIPRWGIKPASPALQGGFLTMGPSGKSQGLRLLTKSSPMVQSWLGSLLSWTHSLWPHLEKLTILLCNHWCTCYILYWITDSWGSRAIFYSPWYLPILWELKVFLNEWISSKIGSCRKSNDMKLRTRSLESWVPSLPVSSWGALTSAGPALLVG